MRWNSLLCALLVAACSGSPSPEEAFASSTATLTVAPTSVSEPTPEPTPDATPEPTPDATPEVTSEPAPEPTKEPAITGEWAEISLVPLVVGDNATSVRPDGWQESAPNQFANHEPPDSALFYFEPTGGSAQGTLARIEAAYGSIPVERTETTSINGLTWQFYSIELPAQGFSARLAIAFGPDGYLIFGLSPTTEIEAFNRTVIRPAIEAFALTG